MYVCGTLRPRLPQRELQVNFKFNRFNEVLEGVPHWHCSDAIARAELRELVGSEESISARGSAAQKDFLADVGADEFGGEQLV